MGLLFTMAAVVALGVLMKALAPAFIPALSALPESADALRATLAREVQGDISADGVITADIDGRKVFMMIEERGHRDHLALVVKVRDVLSAGARVEIRAPVQLLAGNPRDALRVRSDNSERVKHVLGSSTVVDTLVLLLGNGQETVIIVDEQGHVQVLADDVGPYRQNLLAQCRLVVQLSTALAGSELERAAEGQVPSRVRPERAN